MMSLEVYDIPSSLAKTYMALVAKATGYDALADSMAKILWRSSNPNLMSFLTSERPYSQAAAYILVLRGLSIPELFFRAPLTWFCISRCILDLSSM